MRIARLCLTNWKNFERVELALQDRLFVVGPNAGGKSNLLDAIRFLHDLVVPGGGLRQAVRLRGGMANILPYSFSDEAVPDGEVKVAIRLKESADVIWEYAVTFRTASAEMSRPVVVSEWAARVENGAEQVLLSRPDADDESDPERREQTALEQAGLNFALRPIVHFLRAIRGTRVSLFGATDLAGDLPANALGAETRPVGVEFLASVAHTPSAERSARLRKLSEMMRLFVPDLERIEWRPSTARRTCLRIFRAGWSAHRFADETKLSDGSLRLLSFFWVMQEEGGALILEEPEAALPPGILQVLVPYSYEAQKGNGHRQLIVSTHSPALLSDAGIAAEEVAIIRAASHDPNSGGATVALASEDPTLAEIMQVGLTAAEAVFPVIDDPAGGLELLRTRF